LWPYDRRFWLCIAQAFCFARDLVYLRFLDDTLRRMSSFHPNVYFVWAALAGWVLTTAAVTAWGTGITKKEFLWSAAPDGGNFICLGLTQANDPKR